MEKKLDKIDLLRLFRVLICLRANVTHRRVEVCRCHSIFSPYFKLLYTIVTFSYNLLYLRCHGILYKTVHGSQGA